MLKILLPHNQQIRYFEACLSTFTYESSAVIVVTGSSVLLELASFERVSCQECPDFKLELGLAFTRDGIRAVQFLCKSTVHN